MKLSIVNFQSFFVTASNNLKNSSPETSSALFPPSIPTRANTPASYPPISNAFRSVFLRYENTFVTNSPNSLALPPSRSARTILTNADSTFGAGQNTPAPNTRNTSTLDSIPAITDKPPYASSPALALNRSATSLCTVNTNTPTPAISISITIGDATL